MSESEEIGTPDFDALGRETLWPAHEWRSAWGRLADQEHRAVLWTVVVELSAGGTRPTVTAAALVQAKNSASSVPKEMLT